MKMRILVGFILGLILLVGVLPQRSAARATVERSTNLESRVSTLEQRISDHADGGVALFLFGAFCALWAQNTGRNAWLWFFFGMLLSVIAVLVLLYKNANDGVQRR